MAGFSEDNPHAGGKSKAMATLTEEPISDKGVRSKASWLILEDVIETVAAGGWPLAV